MLEIADFEEELNSFSEKFNQFHQTIRLEIEKIIVNMTSKDNFDIVNDIVVNYFQKNEGYEFNDIIEIIKEGEFRYRNEIPPGYKDTEKKGIDKFGDLIIWKEILDIAKSKKKSVILIINDTKHDWCYREGGDSTKIFSPREELIDEFYGHTRKDFWMYTLTQFLHKAKEMLNTQLEEKTISNVELIAEQSQKLNKIPILIDLKPWIISNFGEVTFKTNTILTNPEDFSIYTLDILLTATKERKKIGLQLANSFNDLEEAIKVAVNVLLFNITDQFYIVILNKELEKHYDYIQKSFISHSPDSALIEKFGFKEHFMN